MPRKVKSGKATNVQKKTMPPVHAEENVQNVDAPVENVENVENVDNNQNAGGVNVKKVSKQTKVNKKLSKSSNKNEVVHVVSENTPAVSESAVETELATVTETVTETQKGGSKKGGSKKGGSKKVRSFKVQLPGNETFGGRFTGLTPYQAANKALSKYYRETSKPKKEIRFTIRESTRGSKRNHYTYNGRREKLKIPVEYAINDGRVITKNYKNRLIKVKKAELQKYLQNLK